jgi:hypothetical protein
MMRATKDGERSACASLSGFEMMSMNDEKLVDMMASAS